MSKTLNKFRQLFVPGLFSAACFFTTSCKMREFNLPNSQSDSARSKKAVVADGDSFGQLARSNIAPAWQDMVEFVTNFHDTVMPDDPNVYDLRKKIQRVRDFLDIFSAAYPPNGKSDTLVEIRTELDTAYERIGWFKDLLDTQWFDLVKDNGDPDHWRDSLDPEKIKYNKDEVKNLRNKVLKWKDGFLEKKKLVRFEQYLQSPALDEVYTRPAKSESKFYWRFLNVQPNTEISGIGNIATLYQGIAEQTADKYQAMIKLSDSEVAKHDGMEHFHDFKKQVRTLQNIARYFHQIFAADPAVKPLLKRIEKTTTQFGDLHNSMAALELARDRKNKKDESRFEDVVRKGWKDLKEKLGGQEDFDKELRELERYLTVEAQSKG